MRTLISCIALISSILLSASSVSAQLVVDTVPDPLVMLEDFFGDRVSSITNLETKGATDYWGLFNAEQTNLNMASGVILANGDCRLAIGPNDLLEVGIFDDTGLEGDVDMDAISGYVTEDACILEFDFIPEEDTITFEFIWASEEYPEWVASQIYNDCFAIFLDGENIALLPDGSAACVNNVNCFVANTDSYVCNDPMNPDLVPCSASFNCPSTIDETTIQYDGWTVPLFASMVLTPGMTYHLKMGVADASDNGADSGAFVTLTDNHPTSISEIPMDHAPITVFPNPSQGAASFVLQDNSYQQWKLIDSRGKLIWSTSGMPNSGTFDWPVYLDAGVYILIGNNQAHTSSIRIVIER
jgi:hypothetical protein